MFKTACAQEPEEVSFFNLITKPETYEGKEIELIGYLRIDPEYLSNVSDDNFFCGALMHDQDTRVALRIYEMIRFCGRSRRALEGLHYRYAGVIGEFKLNNNCAHHLQVFLGSRPLGCLEEVWNIYRSEIEGLDEPFPDEPQPE